MADRPVTFAHIDGGKFVRTGECCRCGECCKTGDPFGGEMGEAAIPGSCPLLECHPFDFDDDFPFLLRRR